MNNTPYNPDWIHRKVTGMTVEEETAEILARAEQNKELPIGTVVFYIHQHGMKREVKWGVVADRYPHNVVLELYDVFERRMINGIPYDEFVPDERYQKLPKGWSYDTRLYEQEIKKIPGEMWTALRKLAITCPQNIQRAIDVGYFVPVRTIDYSHIDVDYQKNQGFRLFKTMYRDEHHPSNLTFAWNEIYADYRDADESVKQYEEEMHIEAEMSDLEWSVYEIDHNLNRAIAMTEANRIKCHNFLLSMDNVEDIETRVWGGYIQWKYWKNKKWNNIDPDAISL